jgi:manganese/zinc/iron transport system ATP- binding protein
MTDDPVFPYGGRRHAAALAGAPALETCDLTVAHPGSAAPAIEAVSLSIPVGARVAVVGPNGAGKSTLLKAVAGLLPVHQGEIRIHGLPVGACHHRVAYLPQRNEVDWRFPIDVRRMVMTGRYVHLGWLRRPGPRDRAIVAEVMERLGLTMLADRQIGQLSGGQQQRVLLARALAQDADLLLLDEPYSGVDARTRAILAKVVDELSRQGKTIVAATHELDRLAEEFDGTMYLDEGRVVPPPAGVFAGVQFATPVANVPQEPAWTG